MHRCNICGVSFQDEILLNIHVELEHDSEEEDVRMEEEELKELEETFNREQQQESLRPSVIQYAPGPSINVELHARALPGSVVTHFKIDNVKLQLDRFFVKAKDLITKTLKDELKRLNFIKFGIILDVKFSNAQNEISPRGFITKNKTLMTSSNIDGIVEDCFEELKTKLQEHEGRGSGWSIFSIEGLDLRVHKHGYGLRGSSFIPLPKKIQNTKSCINVQNEDNECFKYAMLAKFINTKPERVSEQYHDFQHRYNF